MPLLRRFSRMTKKMRPSHRTDILCHALLYYGLNTKQKLGMVSSLLCNKQDIYIHQVHFWFTAGGKQKE